MGDKDVDGLSVTAEWDDETQLWVATSDDIPGLVTEAPDLDALLMRVRAVAPELLQDNRHQLSDGDLAAEMIDLHIVAPLNRQSEPAA